MSKPKRRFRQFHQPPVARPQQQAPQQVRIQQVSTWSGPLPAPADLERFNELVPGGAARIMAMAEAEQKHRIDYESRGLTASTGEAKRGQILGAALSALAIFGAVLAVYLGAHPSVPIAFVSLPLVSAILGVINRSSAIPKTPPQQK